MNGVRATLAIVRREMTALRLLGIATSLILGVLWGMAIEVQAARGEWLAVPSVRLLLPTGPIEFALTLLGLLLFGALAASTIRVRDSVYFAAPLYGRQLARAHAVVATCCAATFPIGLAVGGVIGLATLDVRSYDGILIAEAASLGAIVAVTTAFVALSATLRDGVARLGYHALAFGAGLLVVATLLILNATNGPAWVAQAITVVVAFIIGFVALRAFGEALARYDPI